MQASTLQSVPVVCAAYLMSGKGTVQETSENHHSSWFEVVWTYNIQIRTQHCWSLRTTRLPGKFAVKRFCTLRVILTSTRSIIHNRHIILWLTSLCMLMVSSCMLGTGNPARSTLSVHFAQAAAVQMPTQLELQSWSCAICSHQKLKTSLNWVCRIVHQVLRLCLIVRRTLFMFLPPPLITWPCFRRSNFERSVCWTIFNWLNQWRCMLAVG